jgi:BirA family transcriptional regulator, biotin operon repressor / biotin---[acetyl-CoA-carboxylase] ligase
VLYDPNGYIYQLDVVAENTVYRPRNAGKLKESIHLQNSLQTKYIGNRVIWFKNLSSTQEYARGLISMNGMTRLNGYVIISDRQQNGTGRYGNMWISPKGGIWLSIILCSKLHPSRIALFSFCASIAVSEAIEICTGIKSRLKWPNDVMIQGKKVSGILVDASVDADSIEHIIIGIGVNANVKTAEIEKKIQDHERPYSITSLQEQLGKPCNTVEIIKRILQVFDKHYSGIETDSNYPILHKWRERAEPIMRRSVQIFNGANSYAGKVVDIDEDGSIIILHKDNRLEKIVSAEFRIRFID